MFELRRSISLVFAFALTCAALFTAGQSGAAADATAAPPGPPGQPVASDLTPVGMTLNWTAAPPGTDPVSQYVVLLMVDETSGNPVAFVRGGATSAVLTGLSPGTTYTIAIEAIDTNFRWGPYSPFLTVTTAPASPGSAPETLTAGSVTVSESDATFDLSWSPSVPGPYPFREYRVYDVHSDVEPVATSTTTSATIHATTGTQTYVVRAVDGIGQRSAASPSVTVTVPPPPPMAGHVLYRNVDRHPRNNVIEFDLNIFNDSAIDRHLGFTSSYYFTKDRGTVFMDITCVSAAIGCENVSFSESGVDSDVLTISVAGTVAAKGSTRPIRVKMMKADRTPFNERNDYSYNCSRTWIEAKHIPTYYNTQLISGVEPPTTP